MLWKINVDANNLKINHFKKKCGATNSENFGKSSAGCSPVWPTEADIRPVSWSRLYYSIINAQNNSYNLHPIQAEVAHLKHNVSKYSNYNLKRITQKLPKLKYFNKLFTLIECSYDTFFSCEKGHKHSQ